MANEQNIIAANESRTSEEARENGRLGGIVSGKVRKQRKTMAESLKMLLAMKAPKGKHALVKQYFPDLTDEEIDVQILVVSQMLNIASEGGTSAVQAAQFVRDTIGEKPVDKSEIAIEKPVILDDIQTGEKPCPKSD